MLIVESVVDLVCQRISGVLVGRQARKVQGRDAHHFRCNLCVIGDRYGDNRKRVPEYYDFEEAATDAVVIG